MHKILPSDAHGVQRQAHMMPGDPRDRAHLLAVLRDAGMPDPAWADRAMTPHQRLIRRLDVIEERLDDTERETSVLLAGMLDRLDLIESRLRERRAG